MVSSVKNLTKFELRLWIFSLLVVIGSFLIGSTGGYLTLVSSVVGVTALIFVSKGDVTGQILTVIFSILYAVISYTFDYYGEMITYLGMTMPIAMMSVISWIRNPYTEKEVAVAHLTKKTDSKGVCSGIPCYLSVLLCVAVFSHGKSIYQYRFHHHQFSGVIFYVFKKQCLCAFLCGK